MTVAGSDVVAVLAALSAIGYIYLKRAGAGPFSHLPLPPGPKRLPIIGNLLNMPANPEWLPYHQWAKDFSSDIIYLNAAGTHIVVLDTAEAAFELLEKRSSIYSCRARLPMVNELMGWDFAFGFMKYGDGWRQRRRVTHHAFHPAAASLFRPHMMKATHNLLNRFIDIPKDVLGNFRHMAAETILSVAYGLEIQPKDDPYIKIAEHGVEGFAVAGIPGTFLVDAFPILKWVPEWFPGAGFHKRARDWKKSTMSMVETPFAAAKEKIAAGTSPHSMVSFNLARIDGADKDQETIIKHAAGTMYGGGSDTTLSALASCVLGLLDKPEVLRKAQEELDRVIKPGHLPDFDDQDSLPYITAITMEALRWRAIVPIGIPHLVTIEDEYKGYRIPAGTIVIANSWAMLHDEDIYPDSFTFNPDRFIKNGKLDTSVRDPGHACWGFGRRICPGRYIAFSSIWITLASMLTVFDIKKSVDDDGNVVEPTHDYFPALISVPKPYECSIKPRSEEAEKLIRNSSNQELFDFL